MRYDKGRSVYHLLTHFQCDMCHFRNIQGGDPDPQVEGDIILMVSIRTATFDAFWSREPGTFRGNFITVKILRKVAREELGLKEWTPLLSTHPLTDKVGMSLDCNTLRLSLIKGRHTDHMKWDSMRKAPT